MTQKAPRLLRGLHASLLVTFACACEEPGAPDTRRELLSVWSADLIVAGYADFEARTGTLEASLAAFCAAPASAALESARTDWGSAQESLKEAEVFAFGPFSRPGFLIGPHLDSWPARPQDIEAMLGGDATLDAALLASSGVYRKGLPAIEYLLYPPEGDAVELAASERRCSYLRALGAELTSRARELHTAWAPDGGNFAEQLSGAGRTSTAFASLASAFGEIVNRMGFTVENIRRDKLGKPLGEDQGGTPAPALCESRFSGRSLANITDNLDGIERLYFGATERGVPGLERYVAERGADFDDEMSDALGSARQSLEAIGAPLAEAVVASPESVRAASSALGELQNLIQVDLINVLGLSVSFNDNDGD